MLIAVLNGPNLNLLGQREPEVYGRTTLAEIEGMVRDAARTHGAEIEWFQTNHEGALVDALQKHMDDAAGAIINPGGLTQHGVSLHDAIRAMPFPVIEVHMTNRHAREEWRGHSIISPAVKGMVEGLGWRSYTAALRALVEILKDAK